MGERNKSTASASARYEARAHLSASVTLAWDTQLGRPVVLKRLRGDTESPHLATLLGASPHPNLAVVRNDFYVDGARVLVMDHVRGTSLAQCLDQPDPIALEEAQSWLNDLAVGLEHFASLGITHGDVKPENVIVRSDGRAVLVDVAAADVSPGADDTAFARLASGVIRRVDLSPAERRSTQRQLRRWSGSPVALIARLGETLAATNDKRRRPALVAAAAALLLASSVALLRSDGGGDAVSQATGAMPTIVATESALPSESDAPDGAGPSSELAAAPELGTNESVLAAPAPAFAARPHRLGIYTPSPDLGQLDVLTVQPGSVPTLQYRNTGLLLLWSHVVSLGDGWLFFYRALDGEMGTAPIEGDGRMGYGDQTIPPQTGWTHVVGAGNGVAWHYRSDTGAVRVLRFKDGWKADDDAHEGRVPAGFDRVVGIGGGRVLHYASRTGQAVLVTVGASGDIATTRNLELPPSWAAIATTGRGHLLGVAADGRGDVVRLVEHEPVVVGQIALGGAGWIGLVGLDLGAVAFTTTGSAVLVEIDAAGKTALLPFQVAPAAVLVAIE